MRPITFDLDFITHPEGSVLITAGNTKVICNASVEDRVPPFLRGGGKAGSQRNTACFPRDESKNDKRIFKGKVSGRTMEIQRLIGRALRAVVDLEKLGERTIWIDCDVIQADGGTRTASITGAFLAMAIAIGKLVKSGVIKTSPVTDYLAAISVGMDKEEGLLLDLNYEEDSAAEVDMNIIMTGSGRFVELQGTGEEATFSREDLNGLLSLAEKGIQTLIQKQKEVLGETLPELK
ncbi:ribonuclease PH [Bacillus velezensis]|nr:ribonuclease PH [Bacillus velezensis]